MGNKESREARKAEKSAKQQRAQQASKRRERAASSGTKQQHRDAGSSLGVGTLKNQGSTVAAKSSTRTPVHRAGSRRNYKFKFILIIILNFEFSDKIQFKF